MSELSSTNDVGDFLVAVKNRIRQAHYQALRAVNKELLTLYWDLGETIHRKQEALGWGRSVVETLASDLQAEFPGRNGFSSTNLWLMRQFYAEYQDKPNLQPLVGEISWSKNLLIMGRCKELLEREPYRDQLPSPEAIAERLRLWADAAGVGNEDDETEVEE